VNARRIGRCFVGCLLAGLFAVALGGCTRHFTRERFESIKAGADDREDVRQILGKPTAVADDVWYYEDLDRHLHAQIFFDDDGRVLSKEWMNAGTGEWEGQSPEADEPPKGEVRERHTKVRRIDED
jgi:outer membrane protein assembly factor BamE (lipoprotein component of BamABCDE complex)